LTEDVFLCIFSLMYVLLFLNVVIIIIIIIVALVALIVAAAAVVVVVVVVAAAAASNHITDGVFPIDFAEYSQMIFVLGQSGGYISPCCIN